uniref:Histone-lysine N-methyltransferase SETMAR n=1 Tax=Acrobeloides nanus TaxID=290746 RepID=A0A914D0C4_9BILA
MGWERLEHPPYSLDLSPSDYHLFRSMKHWLRGKKFTTIEEMRESLLNSSRLRTEIGTAVASINLRSSCRK